MGTDGATEMNLWEDMEGNDGLPVLLGKQVDLR